MTDQTRSDVPLLRATGLVKTFRSKSLFRGESETRALDDVSIDILPGEVVALIGESGSGKTTFGKAVTRLTPLDSGTVLFQGQSLLDLGPDDLLTARRSIQMLFQNQTANLHPRMTVSEMLDESLRLHRPELDAQQRQSQATDLLKKVGLSERFEQRPASLSGGERRRAGLARILATRPKLIVADEPTSGLDAAIKLQIIDLLKELKDASMTYLLISHDLGLVRRIADRVVVMLKGKVVEEVDAADFGRIDSHHPYTQLLLNAADLGGRRPRAGDDPLQEGERHD
jgi:ABC-type glutathione transport system ATPase component